MEEFRNKIICGDARDVLRQIPANSIDMCITSPPYWALRQYDVEDVVWNDGWQGQLGLEPDFRDYIRHLKEIFSLVKRVIKKEGSIWVNIGDTYYTKSGGKFLNDQISNNERTKEAGLDKANELRQKGLLPPKCLVGIPERFAIMMTDELGLIRRNTIIWHKLNPIPSSASDRFTIDFEYLYFFVKSRKYYFEQQFEPALRKIPAGKVVGGKKYIGISTSGTVFDDSRKTRNKRCVWSLSVQPYSEAHFATFSPNLLEVPIKACCPQWICKKCGIPRMPIFKKIKLKETNIKYGGVKHVISEWNNNPTYSGKKYVIYDHKVGYTNCGCNAGFDNGIVLDPFIGAGTTAVVARKLGRNFIGIELSRKYIEIAKRRLRREIGTEMISKYI